MAMIDPIRLCCGQSHSGPQCPDDKVMCCLCFDRFTVEELAVDPTDGKKWDVCKPCQEAEDQHLRNLGQPPTSPPVSA